MIDILQIKGGQKLLSDVSSLNSDLQTVTATANKAIADFENYYTKSQVDTMVSSIPKMSITVVNELPTSDISNETIYLVRSNDQSSPNLYTEYIYVNDGWEILGSQIMDLSIYATKSDLQTAEESIPTKTSELTNDSGFITASDITVVTETAQSQIMAMDNTVVQVGETYLLVTIGNNDYVVHVPQARVASDILMTGYTNTNNTNAIAATDNVSDAINKLESRINAGTGGIHSASDIVMTGFEAGTSTSAVATTDNLLQVIAKLQNRIDALEAQMENAIFSES